MLTAEIQEKIKNLKLKEFGWLRISSQFPFCHLPFVLDTYKGCNHWCTYCFSSANNLVNKAWNKDFFNSASSVFNPKLLERLLKGWDDIKAKDHKQLRTLIENRVPLHIGWNSDPFSFFENKYEISFEILKLMKEYEYPFILSTKSDMLSKEPYLSLLKECKYKKIQVSLISINKILNKLEPWTTIEKRLNLIKTLSDNGIDVIVRLQPFIIWLSNKNLKWYVRKIKELWAKAITVEFLKLTVFQNEWVKKLYNNISKILNYDIIEYYRNPENARSTGSDFELFPEKKIWYVKKLKKHCKEFWLELYLADNELRSYWDGPVCCWIKENEPWFEWVLGTNTSKALFIAKEKGEVHFKDIYKEENDIILKSTLLNQWLNSGGKARYAITKDKNFLWKFIKSWNDLWHKDNPANFFYNLEPMKVDENWFVVFKYLKNPQAKTLEQEKKLKEKRKKFMNKYRKKIFLPSNEVNWIEDCKSLI